MYFITRSPPSENPERPAHIELLGVLSSGTYFWTTRPGQAMQFYSQARAELYLTTLSVSDSVGAIVRKINGER